MTPAAAAGNKSPWQQIADKCPVSEIFGSADKAGSCLAGYAAAIALMPYEAAGEVTDFIETATDKFETIFNLSIEGIIARIVKAVGYIVGFIVAQEMYIVSIVLSPDTFQYATFPAVQVGFYVSLQIANGLLAIGLVILANKFILGIESYGNLQSLSRYLITALLINFSLLMASYLVGISNFLTIAFLNFATMPQTGGTDSYAVRLMATMNQFSEVFSGLIADYGDFSQDIFANIAILLILIVFSLFLIMILGAIIISLLTRVIALWILMMIVPLAIAADTVFGGMNIPGIAGKAGNLFNSWMSDFIKWISFGPIMAGVIWFVFLIMGQLDTAFLAQAADPSVGLVMSVIGRIFSVLAAMIILFKGYEFAHSSSRGIPGFVDNAVKSTFSFAEGKGVKFLGKDSLTKFGMGLADSKPGAWAQRHVPFVGGWLTQVGQAGKKMRAEDQQHTTGRWQHMYDAAQGDAKKKSIAEQVVLNYKDTADPKLLGFINSNEDAREAFLNDYVAEKAVNINNLTPEKIEKIHKQIETDMAKMAQFAKQSGVETKISEEDIYKANPLLAGEEFAKFARKMSGKEMGALEKESLEMVLSEMLKKDVPIGVNQANSLIDEISGNKDKSTIAMKHISKAMSADKGLAKGIGKNPQSTWWLNKYGGADAVSEVKDASGGKKPDSGSVPPAPMNSPS